MTAYKITGTAPALYVIQTIAHGHTTHQDISHGPYKNEESAKRRIRNLKAKDAEAVKPIDTNPGKPSLNPGSGIGAQIGDDKIINVISDHFTIASPHDAPIGLLAINKHGDVVQNPAVSSDALTDHQRVFVAENVTGVQKLAMSSAYGKINRPVGVYPAIPKRAYQR